MLLSLAQAGIFFLLGGSNMRKSLRLFTSSIQGKHNKFKLTLQYISKDSKRISQDTINHFESKTLITLTHVHNALRLYRPYNVYMLPFRDNAHF